MTEIHWTPSGSRTGYLIIAGGLLSILLAIAGLVLLLHTQDHRQIKNIAKNQAEIGRNQAEIGHLQAKLEAAVHTEDRLQHLVLRQQRQAIARSNENRRRIRHERALIASLDRQLEAVGVTPAVIVERPRAAPHPSRVKPAPHPKPKPKPKPKPCAVHLGMKCVPIPPLKEKP